MATSFTTVRRFAGVVITLVFCLCLTGIAVGQGAAPLVTATSVTGLDHPATGWGTIVQSAIDKDGNWLVVDFPNGALYEFPADGSAMKTLVAPGGLGSVGGYTNPAIVLDSSNDLFLGGNWSNCLLIFPYDPVAKTWPGLDTLIAGNTSSSQCGKAPYGFAQYGLLNVTPAPAANYFQPFGLAMGPHNTLVVGDQGNTFIFTLAVVGSGANAKPGTATAIINGLKKRAMSIATDPEGNIYFVEDSGGLSGVYMVPAGSSGLASDCAKGSGPGGTDPPLTSTCLTRVDPNLPNVTAVTSDAAGNLYISDSVIGVVMVPNPSGTPQTSEAVLVTPVPAQGQVAIDWARNIMYVPTSQKQANNLADVAKVNFGFAELGALAVKATSAVGTNVVFGFQAPATISRFVIVQDGAATPDFAITGGTCTTGTSYAALSNCKETVSFTPSSVGSISARLLMQKADPVAAGGPDASDAISAWCGASGILTLTAANSLVPGELIQFSAKDNTDPLYGLDGEQFNVLAAGLTKQQFAIKSSEVSTCPKDNSTPTAATITAYAYTTLSSIRLHGVGVGANGQATPAQESSIGGALVTPSQVALDRQGNVYVADPGQGKVLMFAAGSGTSSTPLAVGTGLVAPTGLAIDGAGNILIADNNNGVGTVYEIPYMTDGLNADAGQITLATGLGANLKLALDTTGILYVADPSNGRVLKFSNVGGSGPSLLGQAETMLTAGFTAPSAVAVDHSGNLYVIDGADLFVLAPAQTTPVTLLNDLSGATGLAVDPSGAVYITSTAGTLRIPSAGGVLDEAEKTAIAGDVANSAAIALDQAINAYLVQSAGGGITVVGTNGTLALPTPPDLTTSTSSVATVTNTGNAPLLVTGYSHSSSVIDTVTIADFTGADGTCIGDSTAPAAGVAAGATCTVAVTFNPQSGEEGVLTGQVGVTSNAINSPVTIATTAQGLALSGSAANISATGSAEVINTVISVAVAPKKSGGAVPTGTVALTFPSWTVTNVQGVTTINPVPITVPAQLDANGKATFTIAPVLAGAQTFTLGYVGDRVYGRSTSTVNTVVAKSAISGVKLPTLPDPSDVNLPFVPAKNGNGTVPYDGTETPWQFKYNIAVNTAFGVPTGKITVMDDSSTCPPGTSTSGIGVASCALTGYKGVACIQTTDVADGSGDGILQIENAGTSTGAQTTFNPICLWAVPQGTTYSPVIYTHYIHAEYSGDPNFQPYKDSTSVLLQSVRGPVVQITQTGNTATLTTAPTLAVKAGSSASIDLTLTSILGYGFAGRNGQLNDSNFPVSLTCDIPLPHAQCAVTYDNSIVDPNQITAPNSVQIPCPSGAQSTQIADGSVLCTPGHATVTVYTNVATGTTTSQNARVAAVTLAGLFGLGMIGLFFRRRSFEKSRLLLMVLLIIVGVGLAVSLTACSTTNLSPQTSLSTTPGTYQMTITAQEVGTQCVSSPNDPSSNCTTAAGSSGKLVYASSNQVSLPFYVTVTVQ